MLAGDRDGRESDAETGLGGSKVNTPRLSKSKKKGVEGRTAASNKIRRNKGRQRKLKRRKKEKGIRDAGEGESRVI